MTSLQSALSSPRTSRILFWIGALVLAAGIVAFLVAVFGTGADEPVPASQPALQQQIQQQPQLPPQAGKTVPLSREARQVADKFIRTAVARKNLTAAWKLSHPDLKQGMTLKEWKTGNIPVTPYPIDPGQRFQYRGESHENWALLRVLLEPRRGSRQKPLVFEIGLRKIGDGTNARWLVDYWMPRANIGVPWVPEGPGAG